MKRTTLLMDDALLVEAQHLAKQRGTTFTAVIDEALREYLRAHRAPRRLSFAGMGRTPYETRSMHDNWDEAELHADIDRDGWERRISGGQARSNGDQDTTGHSDPANGG